MPGDRGDGGPESVRRPGQGGGQREGEREEGENLSEKLKQVADITEDDLLQTPALH